MADLFTSFITPLMGVFDADEKRSQEIINRLKPKLAAYGDQTLRRATEILFRTRRARSFPSFAECMDAVYEAAKGEPGAPLPAKKKGPVGAFLEGQAIARRVCVGPMVAEAWKANWFGGLWDFCAANHRLPEDREIARIRSRSQENHEIMRREAAGNGEMAPLARSMLARYRRLANQQIGKS